MKVILDCNIWISFLLGHQASLVKRIMTDPRLDVYVCSQLIKEICDVSRRDKIRKRVAPDEVDDLLRIIHSFCQNAVVRANALSVIRDPKDVYLLSLAESIDADYIVSGDADLIVLQRHLKTKMMTLADFKRMMQYP